MNNITGKTAFSQTPQGAPASSFEFNALQANAPGAMGVPWCITLAAWQANGAGVRQGTGLVNIRARVTWGGGGDGAGGAGQETAEIDYPTGGTTFTVYGTSVRVDIFGSFPVVGVNDVAPLLGGWLSHGQSSAHVQTATKCEAYRTGVSGTEVVPPRARAFRLYPINNAGTFTMAQLSGNASPATLANDTYIGFGLTPEWSVPQARSAWYPLHPKCATMVVSANPSSTWCVEWLLELG